MSMPKDRVDPSDIEVTMTHHTSSGEEVVKIPDSIKLVMAKVLTERTVERNKSLQAIEDEFGKQARDVSEVVAGWMAHSMMMFRAIHKSNIPQPIEDSLNSQEAEAQAKICRIVFDFCFPPEQRTTSGNLTGPVEEWPQSRIVDACLQCAKNDILALDASGKHLETFARAATAASASDGAPDRSMLN